MWQSPRKADGPKRYEITGGSRGAARADDPRAAAYDAGLFTVSAMNHVALVFLGMKEIRERQADDLRAKLNDLAGQTRGRIAVSLSEVSTLTSSGINALVAVHQRCQQLGGHLAIFAAAPEIRRMIQVTKLDRAFVVADNAQEAVKSFGDPGKRRGFFASAFRWGRQEKDAA